MMEVMLMVGWGMVGRVFSCVDLNQRLQNLHRIGVQMEEGYGNSVCSAPHKA